MAKKQESVTPGQRLGYAADYQQGAGTYERDGLLYASVVGQRYIDPAKDDQVKKTALSICLSNSINSFNTSYL